MTEIAFILITLLSFALFYLGSGKDKRVLIFFLFWILVVGILSLTGFFQRTDVLPPRLLLVVIPSVFYIIHFYKKLKVESLKVNYLLAIHILRLPIELVLYFLFLQKKIPVIMTFHGWNFDIIIGNTAIILWVYIIISKKALNKTFFKLWNIAGIIFLSVIVFIAILSTPSPIQKFAFDQPNIAILQFPFAFLPAVVVPIVLISHLLCLKALKARK
ncbi:MAG: hypothetical protein H0W73_11035 [Bacteroidetes bacterium]|nr:hypothetical protein [Bacteroidota bacterium]